MMPVALMWMEARCDGLSMELPRESRCHETGPGRFYKRSDLARKDTEKAGWEYTASGHWFCPACRKVRDAHRL
jgi:hypothetical protein